MSTDTTILQSLGTWLATPAAEPPVTRAVQAAGTATTLGGAFAVAIQAALSHALPGSCHGRLGAVAVSEDGGSSPNRLAATVSLMQGKHRLTGAKAFVTLGSLAPLLFVVAADASAASVRGALRVCIVEADATGVERTRLPSSEMAPDLPHARITFDRSPVRELIAGDAYEHFMKPFRLLEDLYASLCALAFLLALKDFDARLEAHEAHAALARLVALMRLELRSPGSHLRAEAALEAADRVFDMTDGWFASCAQRAAWQRDRPLLRVGSAARKRRAERAAETLQTVSRS